MSLDAEQTAALEALFRAHWEPLYRYANRMLHAPSLAEEAVQEAFLLAVMKYEELRASGNPEGWLYRTVYYVVQNQRRARQRGSELVLRLLRQEQEASSADGAVFAGLTEDPDFQLIRRVTLEGYSMRETAEQLGISLEACKKRVQRARQRLRERLKND